MRYELYYWPTIPGRGEFVRLALEDSGVDYIGAYLASPRRIRFNQEGIFRHYASWTANQTGNTRNHAAI